MNNKIITMILILAILAIGCNGKQPFNPTRKLESNNVSTNNSKNNNVDNGEKVIGINNIKIDNVESGNNANVVSVENGNNVSTSQPAVETHNPVYKSYTVREVGINGPRDVLVTVDVSSWKMEDFIKNNKPLSDSFLRKVRSGSQKIKGDNGRIRFFFDSNGDIYNVSRGEKIIYKKYLGPVLVKHTDPDYPGIHRKYVVGMLYQIMQKDSRVTEQFEKTSLPQVGEYEVLILDQDKINVPNRKTIYMDSYKIDPRYDLNPENFYHDYPMRGGNHRRTRLVPVNWREYIFSN